jgi:uncharacterized protein with HEPN domain
VRINYPQIPWKNIAGRRDKLVREYWAIDEQVVWKVANIIGSCQLLVKTRAI